MHTVFLILKPKKPDFERIGKKPNVQKCVAVGQNFVFVLSERAHLAHLILVLIWGWALIASTGLWKLRSFASGKLRLAVSWAFLISPYIRGKDLCTLLCCACTMYTHDLHMHLHITWPWLSAYIYMISLFAKTCTKKKSRIFYETL